MNHCMAVVCCNFLEWSAVISASHLTNGESIKKIIELGLTIKLGNYQ